MSPFITFSFLYRKKYWLNESFWFPVFDEFTSFGLSWTQFDDFRTGICLCLCYTILWVTNAHNPIKHHIWLGLDRNGYLLKFGVYYQKVACNAYNACFSWFASYNYTSSSMGWNVIKINIRDEFYQELCWLNFDFDESIWGAAMLCFFLWWTL